MPQELTDMDINKVSLVERGANGRTIAVLKRDGGQEPVEPTPPDGHDTLRKIAGALGLTQELREVPVEKGETMTFASIVAADELTDALYDAWYTLEDALWGAVYAWEDGEPASMARKRELVAQNLDEFKAWLLAQMDDAASIAKGDERPSAVRSLEAFVRKEGRKISADRFGRLKSISDELLSVLAEVEDAPEDGDVNKQRADAQEEAMTGAELAEITKALSEAAGTAASAAVEKAVEPLKADIEKLQEAQIAADPKPAKGVEKDGGEGKPLMDADGVIPEPIGKVFDLILDRLDAVEKAASRGGQTSLDGQDDTKVTKSAGWRGRM